MNEFQLISRYFEWPTPHADLGVGDDAALMSMQPDMQLAVSADMLVEGRHFFAGTDPCLLGRKVLAVNLSDMAAMGAIPRWFTLSLALPSADSTWLSAFSTGMRAMADEFCVDLVGGDTTRGPLTISVQIMGEVEKGCGILRSGARPGDDLWVSGMLGSAAAAVMHRSGRTVLPGNVLDSCAARLDNPIPRVDLGRSLRGVASAALDISDGLLGDAGHIAERSGCGVEVELQRVPYWSGLECLPTKLLHEAILSGGDDYELCFAASQAQRAQISALAETLELPLTRVGRITTGAGVQVIGSNGQALAIGHAGFDHFA